MVVGSKVHIKAAAFSANMLNMTRYIWMHSNKKRGKSSSKAPISLEKRFKIRPENKSIKIIVYHFIRYLLIFPRT